MESAEIVYDVGGIALDRPFRIERIGHFGYMTSHLRETVKFLTEDSALAWHSRSDRVISAAYGKNLTDKFYATQLVEADVADTISAAPGRTYGITVGFKY